MKGSLSFVDMEKLDLESATALAQESYGRPSTVFPFECAGDFPIPTREDQVSPIEHVILIVKENKTFDCVFGDLSDMDVNADPSLVLWGEEITPNLHALARQFVLSDNFYTEALVSDTGHLFLTATHLTEYVERVWIEVKRSGDFQGFQISDPATPSKGNFFTHLLDHGRSIRIFGEVVGMFVKSKTGKGAAVDYTDINFPGGPFVNYATTDQKKVEHVLEEIEAGELADFTYLLLPNDHTMGTSTSHPTPESMIADNDYAVGRFVHALSRSQFWEKSAVFIVQDDAQGCEDHVDVHRSFALIVSPWVKRGYISHVHTSFSSVFATIERILKVPPMGRSDASATPFWDAFTQKMDPTPYNAIDRKVPEQMNGEDVPGAKQSNKMDFRGPDRNPKLGVILKNYRHWRMGKINKQTALKKIEEGPGEKEWEELIEEANEERTAFDRDWERYQKWKLQR